MSLGWISGHRVARDTGSPCLHGLAHTVWAAALQGAVGRDAGQGYHATPPVNSLCPAPCTAVDGAGWPEVQLPGFRLVFIFQAERELVMPKPFCV